MTASTQECARVVLDAVPHLMRVIREHVRESSNPDLTIPQFRALAFVGRNDEPVVSDVAAFLGLTLPAASKIVDALAEAKLVSREEVEGDRRRTALKLTAVGKRKYSRMVEDAETFLAGRIENLAPETRIQVMRGLQALHQLFDHAPEVRPRAAKRNNS